MKMAQVIIYGRGLIAEEYCRYLRGRGMGDGIACFAVTSLGGQGAVFCGLPCMEIKEALERFPEAEVHLTLQEKHHREVIGLLTASGRKPASIIGLRRMTELLGEQGMEQISKACPELTVRRCPHDYSMLEICPREQPEKKFSFYPMTQVPLSAEDLQALQKTVDDDIYGRATEAKKAEEDISLCGQDLFVAMATSAKDAKVGHENLPPFVHPVLGGAASCEGERSEDLAYDDEGDNISEYNHLYSELTVAFWLWKKAPKARYLGLCHYRRHFVLTEEIKNKLTEGTVDVLLTTPRLTFPSVRDFFTKLPVSYTDELDYETMLAFIGRLDKDMADFAEKFLAGQVQYPNNMVIAKREIYLQYCEFMFTVLQGMQAYYRERDIPRTNRYLGNVGEMLTAIYFSYHKDKWHTGYIDYRLLE